MTRTTFRLGTRGSLLARTQSDWVADQLRTAGHCVEIVVIKTGGDQSQSSELPLDAMGSIGVFTKEIQSALLEHEVDLTVHSLKDLPTEPVPGLALAAVPPREVAHDVLIARQSKDFVSLPSGSRLGTGSVRRRAQILHARDDLRVAGIRGNVDTRLKKLAAGEYDAIVLAAAGLYRLGWQDRITFAFPTDVMIPAVGQGALGIEIRQDDHQTNSVVSGLNHVPTQCAVVAERALLAGLRGGCSAPIGSFAIVRGDELSLTSVVLSREGAERLIDQRIGKVATATSVGEMAAKALLDRGAGELITESRN